MVYVDGYVLCVPKKNLTAYKKMATAAGKIWMKHGALKYVECVGQDMAPNMGGMKILTFPKLAKPKPNEKVLFSFIVYESRAHRDSVNKKVMKIMMNDDTKKKDMQMPFDLKRMAYGGFASIVDL